MRLVRLAVVDPERCVGCQCCMFACARRHEPGLAESCIGIESLGGMEKGFTVIVCRACDDPPCARVCPVDALRLRKGGGVLLDAAKCIGCGHCREACVLGAVYWDERDQQADDLRPLRHVREVLPARRAGAGRKGGRCPCIRMTRSANVLYVDLTKKSFRVERREDLFERTSAGRAWPSSCCTRNARRAAIRSGRRTRSCWPSGR